MPHVQQTLNAGHCLTTRDCTYHFNARPVLSRWDKTGDGRGEGIRLLAPESRLQFWRNYRPPGVGKKGVVVRRREEFKYVGVGGGVFCRG